MTPRIRTAVIPAAGSGQRMLPITRVVAKELLPVLSRPAIQYIVEEALASGITRFIVVVNRDKRLVLDYLEWLMERTGCRISMQSVDQPEPKGLGDAVRLTRDAVGGESFVVMLPDVLMRSDLPVTRQLLDAHREVGGCVIASRQVPREASCTFGMLELEDENPGGRTARVRTLIEKPRSGDLRFGIFGRYVLEPAIFDELEAIQPSLSGEVQLTDGLARYATGHPVYACFFDGEHFDIGSPFGWLEANLTYALRDNAMGPHLRTHLRSLQDKPSVQSQSGNG